jgi:hypothetical protein
MRVHLIGASYRWPSVHGTRASHIVGVSTKCEASYRPGESTSHERVVLLERSSCESESTRSESSLKGASHTLREFLSQERVSDDEVSLKQERVVGR